MKTTRPAAALALLLALSACGGDGDGAAKEAETIELTDTGSDVVAQVASYDLEVERPQRFLLGVLTADNEVVGGGTVEIAFGYLGTKEAPIEESTIDFEVDADYILLPGQQGAPPSAPEIVDPSRTAGVYRARDVVFDRPGFWGARVEVTLDGKKQVADTAFEVVADSAVVEVGDPAPRTVNHLPGAEGVPVKAIDSRAEDDGTVPDPELHSTTVADAVAAGRSTVVVVYTPVYCVSRFCGPITDEIANLAGEVGDEVAFAHLEVWRDYEERALNKAAAEWIYPEGAAGANEPWVFVVDSTGVVTHRFDNVASASELGAAIDDVRA